MDDIRKLQRDGSWDVVPNHYSTLRRELITIEQSRPEFQQQMTTALTHLGIIVDEIEGALANKRHKGLDVTKFNRVISTQSDELERIRVALRKAGI